MGRAGRPSEFSEEVATAICDQLADGASLRGICAKPGMPDRVTVFRWLHQHEEFAAEYARARESGVEVHYEDMDDIEKKTLAGKLDPKAANVVLGNKRWRLEKLKSRVFGVKQQIDHGVTGTLEQLVMQSMPAALPAPKPEGESET